MLAPTSSQKEWGAGDSHPDGPVLPQHRASTARKCTDAEVDAYAQQILESHATQTPDASLGSYVTSLLRSSEEENVQDISDFDSLLELVQEHCACSESEAVESLQIIATAVRTQEIPDNMGGASSMAAATGHLSIINPQHLESMSTEEKKKQLASPLHADDLIPVDLMGALDDPSTPQNRARNVHQNVLETPSSTADDTAFPPLGTTAPSASASHAKKKPPKRTSNAASKPQPADDLAAALFVQPRSRQSSIDETSPNLQPTPVPAPSVPISEYLLDESTYRNTIEMLLSMNADLSEDAALTATQMSPQADVNVAQYLIDSATSAPPVCRHMLQSGCYRSDCQFSHDVNGHTCSFWLRGRCGKGPSCRFLHGFNPQLLEGIYQTTTTTSTTMPVDGNPQPTAEFPELSRDNTALPSSSSGGLSDSIWGGGASTSRSSKGPTSFANIASQGSAQFVDHTAAGQRGHSQSFASSNKPRKVDIPQEVWSAHENRDSSAFYIADPMERFHAVAAQSTRRPDVIDLHFQSLKTFAHVLSQVLPAKMERHSQIWVVTGTGHSVSARTHQKGGGALEQAVERWLEENGYTFAKGRDRNGLSGALFVYQ